MQRRRKTHIFNGEVINQQHKPPGGGGEAPPAQARTGWLLGVMLRHITGFKAERARPGRRGALPPSLLPLSARSSNTNCLWHSNAPKSHNNNKEKTDPSVSRREKRSYSNQPRGESPTRRQAPRAGWRKPGCGLRPRFSPHQNLPLPRWLMPPWLLFWHRCVWVEEIKSEAGMRWWGRGSGNIWAGVFLPDPANVAALGKLSHGADPTVLDSRHTTPMLFILPICPGRALPQHGNGETEAHHKPHSADGPKTLPRA